MPRPGAAAVLVGRDSARSLHYLLGATGLFVLTLGLWRLPWLVDALDVTWSVNLPWLVGGFAIVGVGAAAVQAYDNGSLLASWALGTAIPLGLYLVPTASAVMPPDETVWWGLWSGLRYGILAGTGGFLLGVGLRRVINRQYPRNGAGWTSRNS